MLTLSGTHWYSVLHTIQTQIRCSKHTKNETPRIVKHSAATRTLRSLKYLVLLLYHHLSAYALNHTEPIIRSAALDTPAIIVYSFVSFPMKSISQNNFVLLVNGVGR